MPGTELILPDSDAPLMLPPPQHELAKMLYSKAAQLPSVLAGGVDPGQFIMACAREVNNLKSGVDPTSVMITVANCAVIGLIPGTARGHAFFIPFRNNKRGGIQECQLVVGYKGFLSLAYGSGFLADVHCEVVLKDEKYKRWNDETGPRLEHDLPLGRNLDYRTVQAAYCIWHSRAGGRGITVIERKELEKINTHRNVWQTNPIQMALKSPLRGAAKLWDVTARMGAAVTLDGQAEAGVSQRALPGVEGLVIDAEPVRPKLADMAPAEDAKTMADNVLASTAAANVAASPPTKKSPEAIADASMLLDDYLAAFNNAASQGIQAAVDDVADKALADDRLDLTAKQQCEKWAAEARKQIKTTGS